MATNPGTVLQVVCNFNMLYIGCQYQVIKKVKKKRKADLPYLSFLQDEIGNTHIFFLAQWKMSGKSMNFGKIHPIKFGQPLVLETFQYHELSIFQRRIQHDLVGGGGYLSST